MTTMASSGFDLIFEACNLDIHILFFHLVTFVDEWKDLDSSET